ncbi:MAG: hypothetical protein KF819_30705 [Labilithrix sp.]|nr:hypothetical protein [Labilithrix sp.]
MSRALAVLLALTVAACGGALSSAKTDFKKGRLAKAKVDLVALEAESRDWTDRERAEYALYRGLVHLSLGDRDSATVWLHEARAMEDARPRTLGEEDRTRLKVALESLAGAP